MPTSDAPEIRKTKAKSKTVEIHEIKFVAYPKLFFIWPLLLAGFLFYPFANKLNDFGLETLGWIYVIIILLVVLTLAVDVNRNVAIFLVVVGIAFWLLGEFLENKGFTIVGNIYAWLNSLDVRYEPKLGLAISIVLSLPFLVLLIYAHVDDRWRITHNEFEHYSLGRMDDSLGRGAKTTRTAFPDVFEMLLGLAGTLIVYNATGTKELRRIPHVLFLPFVRKKLNRILERTAITAAETEEEEDDDDV